MALAATLIAFAVLLPAHPGVAGGPVGDADCNGQVNAIDAALVLQRSAGLIASLPCPAQADANQDGSVTAVDAALILQFNAGLLDSLPPSGAALRVHHIDVEQGDVPLL